jgi:hypothetical protein
MPERDRNDLQDDPGKPSSHDEERGMPLPEPYPDYVPCPHCGELEVEVWCYETKAQCHNCGKWIEHTVPICYGTHELCKGNKMNEKIGRDSRHH